MSEKVDTILIVTSGADRSIVDMVGSLPVTPVITSAYNHYGLPGIDPQSSIISFINFIGTRHKILVVKDWVHGGINWLIPYVSDIIFTDLATSDEIDRIVGYVLRIFSSRYSSV